ncbi:pentatricopeptide repeat-containing protein At4g02750 [Selaginella moellendorffii]|uniref:pentatricopeptide repeat-containing protein At4g02750 n=1 Tax=Selaginella moellendorffii TaxID=88036 RepID=UPI000D1C6636|nr:pentatricopeptide repeat-containing protein At4g02750 [Selaginella moellendorffii]|eukprot:XP_024523306.1 pentatricopeptide repeat-containing protein At4g02750 [Selaginella moellendorffii]
MGDAWDRRKCLELVQSVQTLAAAKDLHAAIVNCRDFSSSRDIFFSNKLIEMYGRCGSVLHAQQAFDRIAAKDNFSWVLLLHAYSRNGYLREAKSTFDAMPQPNMVAWNAMLAAFAKNGQLQGARQIFDTMPARNLVSWVTMLDLYARNHLAGDATWFFDNMPDKDLVSWNAILSANARCGCLEKSKSLFETMPLRNVISWTNLLVAYGQKHLVLESRRVFDLMPERDQVALTSLLAVYAQAGHIEETRLVFDGIQHQDMASCSTMLGAYAQNGHLDEAKKIFDNMPVCDLVSWNCLASAYVWNGDLESTKQVFDVMPEKNVFSWTIILAAQAQRGHLGDAAKTFRGMPQRDSISWSAMLAAYTQNGKPEIAEEIFHELKMVYSPDHVSFVSGMIACAHQGKVYQGRCHFVSMVEDFGLPPLKQHYSCVIDLLGKAGYLEFAHELMSCMPFVPEAVDWLSFLGSCRSYKALGYGAFVAGSALDSGAVKDSSGYVLLASLFCMEKKCVGFPAHRDELKLPPRPKRSTTQLKYDRSSSPQLMFVINHENLNMDLLQAGRSCESDRPSLIALNRRQEHGVHLSKLIEMYGKCGSTRYAKGIFNAIASRGASAVLVRSAFCKNRRNEVARNELVDSSPGIPCSGNKAKLELESMYTLPMFLSDLSKDRLPSFVKAVMSNSGTNEEMKDVMLKSGVKDPALEHWIPAMQLHLLYVSPQNRGHWPAAFWTVEPLL